MQSKKFFFNKTVFLKNIKQFWPLWGAYLALILILNPLRLFDDFRYSISPDTIQSFRYNMLRMAVKGGLPLTFIFGVLSAVAVFSFMYNSKSAGFYTNLPVTRTGLFFTQYISGFTWLMCSNLITAVILIFVEIAFQIVDIPLIMQWFAIMSLYSIFFYSFAVFCSVLTGHNMVTIPIYLIFNFCFVVIEYAVKSIMQELIFGITVDSEAVLKFLSPAIQLNNYEVNYRIVNDIETGIFFDGWFAVIGYALSGILFGLFALMIFRKRHMETASDVVAVKVLKPVFRFCMAFGCALCGGVVLNSIFSFFRDYTTAFPLCIYMIISGFIGFFAADMMIEKTFKVFKKRRWIEFSSICSIIILFIIGLEVDLFGVESYIPDISNITSAEISCYGEYVSSDPDVIGDIVSLHENILEHKYYYKDGNYYEFQLSLIGAKSGLTYPEQSQFDKLIASQQEYWSDSRYVSITYNMRNGRTVDRLYKISLSQAEVDTEGSVGYMLDKMLNSLEAIKQRLLLDTDISELSYICCWAEIYQVDKNNEYIEESETLDLSEVQTKYMYKNCIESDVENGIIGKISLCKNSAESLPLCSLYIDFKENDKTFYDSINIDITDESSKTFEYVKMLYKMSVDSQNVQ